MIRVSINDELNKRHSNATYPRVYTDWREDFSFVLFESVPVFERGARDEFSYFLSVHLSVAARVILL